MIHVTQRHCYNYNLHMTGCKDFTEASQRRTEHDDDDEPAAQNPDAASHQPQSLNQTPAGQEVGNSQQVCI